MKTLRSKKIITSLMSLLIVLPIFAYADNGNDDRGKGNGNNSSDRRFSSNDNSRWSSLREKDIEKIDRILSRYGNDTRNNFINLVISRINTLISSIQNSNLNGALKAARIGLLEDLRLFLQDRMTSFEDSSAPVLTGITSTSLNGIQGTFLINSTENGKLYYVVLPSGSPYPTSSLVRSGMNSLGVLAGIKGSINITSGTNTFNIYGLNGNTDYVIYLVAEDNSGNLSTNVVGFNFNSSTGSGSDVTAPTFTISLTGTSNMGTTMNINMSEAGRGYFVVLPSGSSTPTASQIRSGTDSSGSGFLIRGNMNLVSGANLSGMSGLSPNTSYTLYFVAEDISGNLNQNVSSLSLSTSNIGVVSPVTSLTLSGITSAGATLNIVSNSLGRGYYVILPNGSLTPTAEQVRSGLSWGGTSASIRGSANLLSGTNVMDISGLASNTSYLLFFAAEDSSGNLYTTTQVYGLTTSQ